ncbi:MAG TPA: hypothetical protein VF526_18580 [Solirubrobacteraceae bacterium]|jgi:hypothetical protein
MQPIERDEALDELAIALRGRLLGEAGRAGASQSDIHERFRALVDRGAWSESRDGLT